MKLNISRAVWRVSNVTTTPWILEVQQDIRTASWFMCWLQVPRYDREWGLRADETRPSIRVVLV